MGDANNTDTDLLSILAECSRLDISDEIAALTDIDGRDGSLTDDLGNLTDLVDWTIPSRLRRYNGERVSWFLNSRGQERLSELRGLLS